MTSRRSSGVTLAVVAALALCAPSGAAACTVDWDGGGGDLLWSTAANWSADVLPAASDQVCIPALSGGPVVVDLPVTASSVAASHPVQVASGQTLSALLDSGTFTLSDAATLAASAIDGATVVVPLGEQATLAGGEFRSGTLTGGGETAITGTYAWTGGRMRGDGVTSVAEDATVTIDADFPNGSPQNYGASIEDDRHLQNSGTIVWADGYVGINDQATVHNTGTLSLRSTTDTWEANPELDDVVFFNTGLIDRPSGTNKVAFPDAYNDGVIRVVRGRLEFDELLQTVDGRIEVELGGPMSATEYGVVSGFFSARLSGTLAVTLTPGYSPADTDVFQVLTTPFGLRRGTFSNLELPALSGGRTLTTSYVTRGVDLAVTLPPPPGGGMPKAQAQAQPETDTRPVRLRAVDDVFTTRAARRLFIRTALANDSFARGTRVRLVSRPRGTRVRVDARTGAMRIRMRTVRRRNLRVRYRLVAPDGRRSRAATVLIRLR